MADAMAQGESGCAVVVSHATLTPIARVGRGPGAHGSGPNSRPTRLDRCSGGGRRRAGSKCEWPTASNANQSDTPYAPATTTRPGLAERTESATARGAAPEQAIPGGESSTRVPSARLTRGDVQLHMAQSKA